jgi:hypothetical protein
VVAQLVIYARYGASPPWRWAKILAAGYDSAKRVASLIDDGEAWLLTVADMEEEHPEVLREMRSDAPLRLREAQRRAKKKRRIRR